MLRLAIGRPHATTGDHAVRNLLATKANERVARFSPGSRSCPTSRARRLLVHVTPDEKMVAVDIMVQDGDLRIGQAVPFFGGQPAA